MRRGAGDEGGETLVRICDLAGRTRGTGFVADDRGTVVTSHEAVDGLSAVVLHAPGDRTWLAEADDLDPLPEAGLALVRTDGLGVRPLPISARTGIGAGSYVRVAAHGWREARVLGTSAVTYTATDRFHLLGGVLELAIGTAGSEAMRLGGEASGGPVVDTGTGAVLGVVGTALHAPHQASGFAMPLRAEQGPLAELLRRNAATVPGYGADLNLAGALQLTATSVGSVGGPRLGHELVERPSTLREFGAFAAGDALVLGLVGDPGTGRTTELAALAGRRARGARPAPTLWLRGADLRCDDTSLADAVARALAHAARIVAAPAGRGEQAAATPDLVARLAREAGRPLLVLLDGPEEMPPVLAHRLAAWTAATVEWLEAAGARLVVACRPEHWEQAGAHYPEGVLHPARLPRLPDGVRIGDLGPEEAARARERYGLADGALGDRDARHPLTLRLLAEVRGALPAEVEGTPERAEVFAAHLDLMCLRIAVRMAASARPPLRGGAVRRLAARVAGQVHEAARRCLGPGQGELDRESFEEIFPWRTGSASAVLTEGLLVPAGSGYRFAHEELADWVQAGHLDLDAALYALVHRWYEESDPAAVVKLPSRPALSIVTQGHVPPPPGSGSAPAERTLPVPRHRIGPVLEAMLLLGSHQGSTQLALKLKELVGVLDRTPKAPEADGRFADAQWWAVHLLAETLLRVPDVRPYQEVLRLLADRISRRSLREGGPAGLGPLGEFGAWFWARLRVGEDLRLDLLRRLVPADGAPGTAPGWERYLDAADRRLTAEPRAVQPLLCRWFTDERPLPVAPGTAARPRVRPTVARAAQALLYARRAPAVDDLTEALVATPHVRAEELLAQLAEDEPSALCRAVDRWAHDDRPERRAAAAAHGPRVALGIRTPADRDLLRYAALALLARPEDAALHGAALALLVRDPATRTPYLDRALAAYTAGDPALPTSALAAALTTHPEPVIAALRARLRQGGAGAADVLDTLAEVTTPALARRAAALVQEHAERHPESATGAAAFVDRRLAHGPAARAVLFPMVTSLLRDPAHPVRRALAPVLAAPGTAASRPLRAELLDVLLAFERRASGGPAVADALLTAGARGSGERAAARTRDLVHRTGLLLARTPEGAAHFESRLIALCQEVPGFAAQVAGWLGEAPHEWAALVGPGARRAVETLGSPMPMRSRAAGHGSLRPA